MFSLPGITTANAAHLGGVFHVKILLAHTRAPGERNGRMKYKCDILSEYPGEKRD
jgi:hypothetical protein